MVGDLIAILDKTDAAVAVLALEGLYRIEGNVDSGQFCERPREKIKKTSTKMALRVADVSALFGGIPQGTFVSKKSHHLQNP